MTKRNGVVFNGNVRKSLAKKKARKGVRENSENDTGDLLSQGGQLSEAWEKLTGKERRQCHGGLPRRRNGRALMSRKKS